MNAKDELIIAITGHRPNKLDNDYDLKSDLIMAIKAEILTILKELKLANNLKQTLVTGMAIGIDTLFAQIAIENNLNFIAAIPCLGQSAKWPTKSVARYINILGSTLCTIQHVTGKPYTKTCMQERNRWMVDKCNVLIAVWDGSPGGTANCVKYANSVDKYIIYIDPNAIRNKLALKRLGKQ